MRITNTSRIDTETLRPLLAFAARGVRDSGIVARVKRTTRGVHGRCWYFGVNGYVVGNPIGYAPYTGEPIYPDVPSGTRSLVTLHLPDLDSPKWAKRFGNYYRLKRIDAKWPQGFPFDGWRDVVVYVAAHEFRHAWQNDRRNRARRQGKRVSGKGEYDAELFALRRVNEYRESTGRSPILEAKQANPFAPAKSRQSPWSIASDVRLLPDDGRWAVVADGALVGVSRWNGPLDIDTPDQPHRVYRRTAARGWGLWRTQGAA